MLYRLNYEDKYATINVIAFEGSMDEYPTETHLHMGQTSNQI